MIHITTGAEQLSTGTEFELYPNPASNKLQIRSSCKIYKTTITNQTGQTLITTAGGQYYEQIDVSSLPAGIYSVEINDTAVRKFVKE